MSEFQDHRYSEDDQQRLNERQAWQLLDIDGMLIRLYRGSIKFGEDRLETGLRCYQVAAETGIFGRAPRYLHEFTSDRSSFPARVLNREMRLFIDHDEKAFPRAAAFLDLVSEWIACDDIYAFLSTPSARHPTPIVRLLISVEKWLAPRFAANEIERFGQPSLGKLISNGVDTDCALRGFLRYVDLSVDIHNFVGGDRSLSQDDRFIDWFGGCMSRWFEDRFAEKALTILSFFEPNTARRTRAVRDLSLLAQRYP